MRKPSLNTLGIAFLLAAGILLAVAFTTGFTSADAPLVEVFPIRTGILDQKQPDVSGDIVVYRGASEGRIKGYNLTTSTDFIICEAEGAQEYPKISGDIVVWQDNRNGGYDDFDIYGYNLSSATEFPICTNLSEQRHPDVSGDIVVWQHLHHYNIYHNNSSSSASRYDIHGYDLTTSTEFIICNNSSDQLYPAISGDVVVWQDARSGLDDWDIYGYNLTTSTDFIICNNSSDQLYPAISGDVVVWQDYRPYKINSSSSSSRYDIHGYDLTTSTEFIICNNSSSQTAPAISGDIVVWVDERNGNYDIYGYNLSSSTEFPICTQSFHQWRPAVSGDVVVWQAGYGGDIYGARLWWYAATATASATPTATPTGGDACAAGDANGDGEISAGDITKVERIILGLDEETPCADANEDGTVNASDIGVIEYMILEIWPWNVVHLEMYDEDGLNDGTVGKYTNFTVVVYITYVEDLASAQYDIIYDPEVIEVTGVTGGRMQEGSTFYDVDIVAWGLIPPATQGRVRIINTIPGASGVSGSGYLAKLHFYVNTSQCLSSDIDFFVGNSTLNLFDSGTNPIPGVTWVNTSMDVFPCDDF